MIVSMLARNEGETREDASNRRRKHMETLRQEARFSVQLLVSEFIATFILVFGGSAALVLINEITHFGVSSIHGMSLLVAQVLVQHLMQDPASGHANPCITIAMALVGKYTLVNALSSIAGQLSGSFCASAFMLVFFTIESGSGNLGLPTVGPSVGTLNAFVFESVYTSVLVIVALTFNPGSKKHHYMHSFMRSLVCGMILCIANLIGTDISNGALNPARALGAALLTHHIQHLWLYIIAPLLGSLLGTVFVYLFRYTRRVHSTPPPPTLYSSSREPEQE